MKHVLIAVSRYERPLLSGITAYSNEHGWMLNTQMIHRMGRMDENWRGDGIIAWPGGRKEIRDLAFSGRFPVVLVQCGEGVDNLPRVRADEENACQMTFEYFRKKGFRYFGCYGFKGSYRLLRFREIVEDAGMTCQFLDGQSSDIDIERERIREWLEESAFPMAVYCDTDDAGARLVTLALDAGFKVPDDIAVLGTDNSTLTCNSCGVRLSSVNTNLWQVGYQAAKQLDLIMNGQSPESMDIRIKPVRIDERESTNTIGATSPHVRKAIAIMEADYSKGIAVADVVNDVGISHSGLKKAFKRELGYTPVVALRNVRMKVANQLLTTTEDKIRTIAAAVGISNPEHFQTLFKNYYGVTPRKYRLGERGPKSESSDQ